MILPVILAGGYGERLWPLSRQSYPKQFLKLIDDNSLLQNTILRLPQTAKILPPLVVCSEEHRFLAAEQLRSKNIKHSGILLEPIAKNTAFAIALAAIWAEKNFAQAITLLILPADHLIGCKEKFAQAIAAGYQLAELGYLTTFGITPTHPETGYGYIIPAKPIATATANNAQRIACFQEKPSLEKAKELVTKEKALWNSGMFIFTNTVLQAELELYQPEVLTAAKDAIAKLTADNDFLRPETTACQRSPKISIDYAVMEKTDKAAVIPFNTNWSDIGNWNALWQQKTKDANNNSISGNALVLETSNSLINSQKQLVATLGVDNLVIVATDDAIFVASREQAFRNKEIVAQLKTTQIKKVTQPFRIPRPWGWFESIVTGDRFQVKQITVGVGKKLSLQLHHHRSEHWIVVEGSAKITRGNETFMLSENQSTYIPIGEKHRLENIGKIPLKVIEVQSGSYLGEDDIVRLQDEHGRATICEGLTNEGSV